MYPLFSHTRMNARLLHTMNLTPEVERIATALAAASETPGGSGYRLSDDEALTLMREAPVALLGTLAVARKRQVSGDEVYYNRNIHIEPTNICGAVSAPTDARRAIRTPGTTISTRWNDWPRRGAANRSRRSIS